jgi:hypothetical protein
MRDAGTHGWCLHFTTCEMLALYTKDAYCTFHKMHDAGTHAWCIHFTTSVMTLLQNMCEAFTCTRCLIPLLHKVRDAYRYTSQHGWCLHFTTWVMPPTSYGAWCFHFTTCVKPSLAQGARYLYFTRCVIPLLHKVRDVSTSHGAWSIYSSKEPILLSLTSAEENSFVQLQEYECQYIGIGRYRTALKAN